MRIRLAYTGLRGATNLALVGLLAGISSWDEQPILPRIRAGNAGPSSKKWS